MKTHTQCRFFMVVFSTFVFNNLFLLCFSEVHNLLNDIDKNSFYSQNRELDLRNKNLTDDELDGILGGLPNPLSIEILDVSHNRLKTLPRSIKRFRNLKKLYIRHNEIENLPENFWSSVTIFDEFDQLIVLDLSYNNLVEIGDGAFDKLRNLKRLRITNNNLRRLRGIWCGKISMFNNLENLEELDLSYNDLAKIVPLVSSFPGLKSLKILNLSHNRIYKIENGSFDGLISLSKLYLAHNNICELPFDFFRGGITLFDHQDKLIKLDLRYNKFKHIFRIGNLRNLKVFDLAHNELESIDRDVFVGVDNLEELYMDFNRLDQLPKELFKPLRNLYVLDLSYNDLSWLDHETFYRMGKLRELYLNNNKLKRIYDSFWTKRSTFLDYLNDLEVLDLSFNDIKSLPENIFSKLPYLKRLYVDTQQRENMRIDRS